MRKRRKRPFFLGGGGGADEGPVFAVPVPVGGRLPVFIEGAGGVDLTSAGEGGSKGVPMGGTSVEVGFSVTVARTGA